ncbi:hypothetical protein CK203_091577 [Vitis vinifera]|uniref:Uncharacterized protein n=1 Tax=Vitis vinifera TaxID=29760 RepID=A0A438D0S6_VITVI|nr:hypothetical protein CK203_091577 [Vitis vinifera]
MGRNEVNGVLVKDKWCGATPLCDSFPSLFALTISKEAWVKDVWNFLEGHHSFRSISLAISHSGHQSLFSEPREKTLSGRSNRRQKTFTAGNFSGELSGDGFFLHRKERLEEISNFPKAPEPETIHAPPHAFFRPATASHAPAREGREPLSGDALPPPGSPDADQPPFLPVLHPSPARASFGVLLLPRAL